jgi:hypothetical protein
MGEGFKSARQPNEVRMSLVNWLWEMITIERVKAAAALVQAFAFIGAAWLAYKLAQKLETHKYEIRVREIMFSKLHEKRLETLESISAIQGKILYETSELLFFGGLKETIPKREDEDREAYLQRVHEPRHKDITSALFELYLAQESGIVYLPDPIYEKLTDFRVAISDLVRTYSMKIEQRGLESEIYGQIGDEARAKFKELKAERNEIVKLVRSYLERDGMK